MIFKKFSIFKFVIAALTCIAIYIGLYYYCKQKTNVYYIDNNEHNKKINIHIENPISNEYSDLQLEQSDLAYYQDLDKEFNIRQLWYEKPKVINENDIDIPVHLLMDLDQGVDHQNVHDSFVQNYVKQIYTNTNTYNHQRNDTIDLGPEVNDIINKIRTRNAFISNLNDYEYNILLSAYDKAKTNENIKENLIWQLKDCKQGDGIYCPTGVTSRIVSSLAIENPEMLPKDKNTVNTEVLAKFSSLYQKNPEADKYEIKQVVLQDYPEDTKTLVSNCIDEWIDHI